MHFGTFVVLNMVIGMVTPLDGILLFITPPILGQSVTKVIREGLPLVAICLVILTLIALI